MRKGCCALWSLAVVLVALSGCGGSSSTAPSEAQLEAAKRQGEEVTQERDRINSLQKQVRGLKHQAKHRNATVVVEHDWGTEPVAGDNGSTVLRTFHALSGNVSCEILSDGALCSVGSIARTFAFSDGQAAHIASGASLAQGAGELAPYGSTISATSVTCTIPLSSEPRGVVCTNADSWHGFEASRISGRQHVY